MHPICDRSSSELHRGAVVKRVSKARCLTQHLPHLLPCGSTLGCKLRQRDKTPLNDQKPPPQAASASPCRAHAVHGPAAAGGCGGFWGACCHGASRHTKVTASVTMTRSGVTRLGPALVHRPLRRARQTPWDTMRKLRWSCRGERRTHLQAGTHAGRLSPSPQPRQPIITPNARARSQAKEPGAHAAARRRLHHHSAPQRQGCRGG